MPDWLFWILVWWAAWFVAFLFWIENRKEPISALFLFFIGAFAGIMPFLILIGIIVKLFRKDK